MNQTFLKRTEMLKTQRILINIGHSFVLTTVMFEEEAGEGTTLSLSKNFANLFGLKEQRDHNNNNGGSKAKKYLFLFLLFASLLIVSSYPLMLDSIKGDSLVRLLSLQFASILLLTPIVSVEIKRKMAERKVGILDFFDSRMLLNLYISSIFFALWNILFTYSLKFTELSTSIFLSNLLLMVLVAHKRFIGKSHGLSEVGMSGATWMAVGVVFFLVKNVAIGDGPVNSTSFFTLKSYFGELLALSASVAAAVFFKRNYDSHSKLPKYSSIILIMSFAFVNTLILKAIELLVLSQLFSAQTEDPLAEYFTILNLTKIVLGAALIVFGSFSFQTELMKYTDPFFMNTCCIFIPFFSILLATFFNIQDLEISTLVILLLFIIPGKIMVLVGMRQFEDRYQGGEIGVPIEMRDKMRIEHFKELEMMSFSSLNE